MRTDITRVALAIALVCAGFLIATSAMAADADSVGGQHPAVLLQSDVAALRRGINPQTFIVAHPARLALQHRHANQEHPAVALQRAPQGSTIDANAYLVQPPSPVRWTVVAEGAVPAAATVAVALPR